MYIHPSLQLKHCSTENLLDSTFSIDSKMSGYPQPPPGYGYGAPPPPKHGHSGPPTSQPYAAQPYAAQPYAAQSYPAQPGAPHAAPSAPSYGGPPPPAPGGYPPASGSYGNPFAALMPSSFPPGTDPSIIACFQLADQDGSGLIDDKELQRALSSYNQSFSLRTVHLLMYSFTNTNSRKIGEFFLRLNFPFACAHVSK